MFGYKCIKENKSIGSNWGEKYYEFLQNMSNGNNKKILFVETDFYNDPLLLDDISSQYYSLFSPSN